MDRLLTRLLTGLSLIAAIGCGQGFQSRSNSLQSNEFLSNNGLAYMSLSSVSGWTYDPIAMTKFNISFTAVPSQNNADIVIGLSQAVPAVYSDLATAVRFNPAGKIDARNGAGYSASASVTYSAGASYRFQMSVDLSKHTYSVTVTLNGQPVVLAQNYAFRSDQARATSLNNFATYGDPGSAAISDISISFSLSDIGTPAPAPEEEQQPPPQTNPEPVPTAEGDGSNAAPNCTIQKPALLNNFAKRPNWKVAGVDYCVGYPSATALKSPTTISMSGVSVESAKKVVHLTGNGVVLNGYDFSNWWVYFEGANQKVINSKFYNSGVLGMTSSSNIYVGYSVIDGANSLGSLIEMRGGGSVTVEYNWLKNSGSDIMQMHTGGRSATLIARYNLIEQAGMSQGAHGDWTEFIDGPYATSILYNTAVQVGGTTQGFMVEPDIGSSAGTITTGEIANNVMTGSVNAFTAVTVPDVVTSFKVHDNYYANSALAFGGIRGGPGDASAKTSWTNNVNMVSGAISVGP